MNELYVRGEEKIGEYLNKIFKIELELKPEIISAVKEEYDIEEVDTVEKAEIYLKALQIVKKLNVIDSNINCISELEIKVGEDTSRKAKERLETDLTKTKKKIDRNSTNYQICL